MKTPKLLPWLARKAGVSDNRAQMLWRAACLQAASITGQREGSLYWETAQRRLLDLLARERWRVNPPFVWPWLLAQSSLEGYAKILNLWLSPAPTPGRRRQRQPGPGTGAAGRAQAAPVRQRRLLPT